MAGKPVIQADRVYRTIEAFVYIDPLVACARAAQKLRRAAS